uniref:C2 domain-containing protein n=1 Tax=Mola mola TaxID=94237 RepID=A0A3Q3XDV6_MOLML
MSTLFDETAADIPVRDTTITLSRVAASLLVYQNARARQDFSRVPREELEDRFLRLHEENLQLKQHIHKQDDKIKKLGTKLMKLVKDRSRLEQLAVGGGQRVSRVRDVEMEEMIEELQDKVRALQRENEGLKQRLLVAKQQLINKQSRRPTPYSHIQSRVSTGLKKPQDDASSPSLIRPKNPSEGCRQSGSRPPTGLLPRFGHSLVEEARAEIRNLENVIEHQRSQMEEMERTSEMLQEDLRNMKAEYEQKLLQARQQQSSKLRSYIDDNVMMIKLQKQLSDKCNAVTELEGRFIHLQECQRILKTSHDAAIMKVDELSAQLRDERKKGLDLKKQLQSCTITNVRMEQLQERLQDVEQERDLLKESNAKLIDSTFDVSQQQKWQIQEQQLKLQISQLEMALRADLADKNEILDKIKAERDTSEKLTEENKKLHIELLEQKQQLDDLNGRFKFYNRVRFQLNEKHTCFITTSIFNVTRKSQKDVEMAEEGAGSVRELRAAHAETILELEKTRKILSMESKICKDYKVVGVTCVDRAKYEQKLEQQAQLLDTRAAKINKLEAQIRDIAYGSKTHVFKPNITDEQEAEEETLDLNRGDNLLEVQIVGATLSPPSLEMLGDHEPSTFCTYAFYLFELHSTPVVTGHNPKYGFTSKYVVNMDDRFLDYVHRCSVTVELHQALGLDWRTVASAQLPLQQLLEHDGKVHGSAPLFGTSDEIRSFGSVDYWLRLRVPMTETIRLYKEKVKAVGYIHSALSPDKQVSALADSSGWNELYITVQSCRDLQFSGPQQPSPYVVYKFSNFPDHPTTTVHDSCHPHFNDLKSYSVPMDVDLDQYLKSELIQFYVFDYKEEQMDVYMGKARVALLPLAQDQEIAGDYELTDLSGLPAGHIEVTLKWKSAYFPPSGSTRTTVERTFIQKERVGQAKQELHRLEDKAKEEALQKEEEEVRRHHSLFTEEEEEESHISEGQLVPVSSHSDDSEISEDITEGEPLERIRVEVLSLSLRPEGWVALDSSVVRLFVEYSLLDLPTEETPLSLPKPPPGKSINYNYRKVVPVDAEKNSTRRQLLRAVLQGRNPHMERIRFTVVSEPPEEEEQERDCEDVGVAFLRIPDILEKQQDLTETSLNVMGVEDSSEVLGSLTVTVEGLEALQAIMQDKDQERTPVSSLLPSA